MGVLATDYLTVNLLPGQFFTVNDQCRSIYGANSSFCHVKYFSKIEKQFEINFKL